MDKAGPALLVTHVAMRQGRAGLEIDDQTAAGIAQWCKHFERVTYYGILSASGGEGGSSSAWTDMGSLVASGQLRLVALPWAYRPAAMMRHIGAVRAELRDAIAQHRHLCFTLGSIMGDWPSLGAWEAIRQKRAYAAWIDRVEPEVIRAKLAGAPLKRMAAEAALPLTQGLIRYLLRRSSVAMLQGGDTFAYYARSARAPYCTYDTHTQQADQIAQAALAEKQARVLRNGPLKIVYVGRVAAMKGPQDWLSILTTLHRQGVPFEARWIGDGPDLEMMRAHVRAAGLGDLVHFTGFEGRRDVVLNALRDSDLLLFCHKTAESARCLIEALVCGCPLVGYESAYPRGLIQRGGGLFASPDDWEGLARHIGDLNRWRGTLSALIAAAAMSGRLYTEDAVYAQRAGLMRQA